MVLQLLGKGRRLRFRPRATRLAVYLLGVVALLCGRQVHAQGYKQLPDASQAIPTQPPSMEKLFRLESESTMRYRMTANARLRGLPPPLFPTDAAPTEPFMLRYFPHKVCFVEPSYVCYGRLYFEQRNAERYGWDLGPIHPLVSLGIFYFDVATLPYHFATDRHRCFECSAGYCLPGDPVPLLLYKPECSKAGILAQALTVGALLAIFP